MVDRLKIQAEFEELKKVMVSDDFQTEHSQPLGVLVNGIYQMQSSPNCDEIWIT